MSGGIKMNKKAQFDFDDMNIVGIIFGLVGAGIGILVAKQMGSGVLIRIMSGIICAIVCYFVGGKIADD